MAFNDISLSTGMRSNLNSLQQTASLVSRTQQRLSTGKKVNSALDNPTSFFTSQNLTQSAADLSSLKDSMNQGIQTIQAADNGIRGITTLIQAAQGIANSALATSSAAARTAYAAQYTSLMGQIDDLASDSGYNGTNLLDGTNTLTVNFNSSGSSNLAVAGVDCSTTGLALVAATNGWAAAADVSTDLALCSTALTTLQSTSATLSSSLSVVQARVDFSTAMINTLSSGADQLTLADMNEEGANMLALQTKQSLGVTALSLSSQANQSVLKLFQ